MEKKILIVGLIIILLTIAFSGCLEKDNGKDNDVKTDYSKIFTISNVSHLPLNPAFDEEVKFTVTVSDKNYSYNYSVFILSDCETHAHLMTNVGNDTYEYMHNYSQWVSESLNGTTINYFFCIFPVPSLDPSAALLCSDNYNLTFK